MAYLFAVGSVKAVYMLSCLIFMFSSTIDVVKEVQQHLQDAGCRNEDENEKN